MKGCFFEFRMALRYLSAAGSNRNVSAVSIFSFLGVMIGVATLISVLSVMNGARQELLGKILGVTGHIIINVDKSNEYLNSIDKFPNNKNTSAELDKKSVNNKHGAKEGSTQQFIDLVEKHSNVKFGYKFISGQVLGSAYGASMGLVVRGVKPVALLKLGLLNDFYGDSSSLAEEQAIIIGSGLAATLGLGIGDSISLLSTEGSSTPFGTLPLRKQFTVVGVFNTGFSTLDKFTVYVGLKQAKLILGSSGVTSVEFFVKDPERLDDVRKYIDSNKLGGMLVSDWRENLSALFSSLQLERDSMFLILVIIVVVACFNIISLLIITVQARSYDIAMLRTFGASNGLIARIFILTGFFISLSGTLSGIGLGILISENADSLRRAVSWISGFEVLSPEYFLSTKLPSMVNYYEVAMIAATALVLGLLSTLYPAWKAMRLNPVDILRNQ